MFSLSVNRSTYRVLLVAGVLLAGSIVAMTMLRSTFAQVSGAIEYAENGTDPVATYTAVDPEGAAVKWSLAGLDAGDFSIDGGVLAFKKSPNYEAATGGGSDAANMSNTYSVTVVATDATRKASMKPVTVTVTNVDEPGTVKLTTLAPRAGIELGASVTDPDSPAPVTVTGPVWQWAKSQNGTSGWGDIDKATLRTYTPADGDAGYYLRAMVTYKDRESVRDTKTAVGVSANAVKAARSDNDAPEFTDEDDGEAGNQATREVAENTAAGEAIGDPIVAEDEDDDVLTYTLYDDEDNADDSAVFAIDRATGQLKTKGKLNHEASDCDYNASAEPTTCTYTVEVRATDPDGMPAATDAVEANSDVITVTIMVTDVNEAPVVSGMAAVTFAEGDPIINMLDMYAATDPEEDTPITLALTGADRGKFTLAEDGDLTFKATAAPDYEMPGDADKDNVYEVTVEATDAVSNTGTKNVKITVTNVDEPGTVTMSQLQPRVGVAITASVTDLDGDVSNVTWQWSRSTDDTNGFTDIEKATSASYKPVEADADPTPMFLRATAMYSDGEGATTMDDNDGEVPKTANGTSANVVEVDTRNRAPVFDDQDDDTDGVQNDETTREVAELTAALGNVGSPVTATDSDPNSDPLDYTLSGADAGFFSVGADNRVTMDVDEGGQIMVKSGTKLDYETKQTYSVTLKAADSFGDYDTIDVTIMVTQVNEAPSVMGEATVEYAENGMGPVATYTAVDPEGAAVKWSLAVVVDDNAVVTDDAGDFSISGGALSFKKSPNYEDATGGGPADTDTSNTYSVTVVATDATRRESMKEVTVNVTNVNEPGTVKLTTLAPRAGIALTASVTDPDGPAPVTGPVWQWAKSRSRTSGWGDIDRATSATYTPADSDAGYYLRAMVTYKDRESVRDTKTAVGVSANQVKATRSQNDAPVFPDQNPDVDDDQSDTATRTVAENTAAGEAIGDPIVAEDDDGDVLTYTLRGTNADHFAIDWATGQLKTKGKLDFEGTEAYVVIVRATDPDGMPGTTAAVTDDAVTNNSDEIMVTITVTEVDEAPAITGAAAVSFAEDGPIDTALGGTYTADDPETDEVPTLALTGADRGKFDFMNGQLMFMAQPDYEKPGDADKDNVYEVTVEATDGVSNTGTKNVKIIVTNVNEGGTVTMSQLQPRVGVAITASVTDLDGDVSNVTWQWYHGEIIPDTLTENAIEKATSATYKPVADDVDETQTLWARAMYTDGFGEGESAMGESANPVALDTRNRAPVFDDQDEDTEGKQNDEAMREVAESAKAADDAADVTTDNVGDPVTATDPDPNIDALVYTLSGPDAASFRVRDNGQIEVGAGTKLDYETKQTYSVTLKAADSFGDYDTIDVTIMVTNVNEPPKISEGGLAITGMTSVDYAENETGMVAMYSATGPESANAMWALSGDDAGAFSISSGGVLTFRSAPDFESPADDGTDNVYMVTVEADDDTYTAERNVVVTVTDVGDDAPVIVDGTLLDKFDTNPQNGQIDKSEVVEAIIAFVTPGASNKPSKQDIVDLIVHFVTTPR